MVVVGATDIVEVVAPALHEYVVAPLAVSTVDVPEHIVGLLTVMVGVAFTVTVDEAVPVQPPKLPNIVYTVVTVGFAVTVEPEVPLNPVAGLHV